MQLFAVDDFSRRHFKMHFFLGGLRVNFQLAVYIIYISNEDNIGSNLFLSFILFFRLISIFYAPVHQVWVHVLISLENKILSICNYLMKSKKDCCIKMRQFTLFKCANRKGCNENRQTN